MILLDPAVITEQKLNVFATVPTHAMRRWLNISAVSADEGAHAPIGLQMFLGQDVIQAVYSYGNLDINGMFAPLVYAPMIHIIVELPNPGYQGVPIPPMPLATEPNYTEIVANRDAFIALEDRRTKVNAASSNLRSPGVVPHPVTPWVAVNVSAVHYGDDFKQRDLDAYVCNSTIGDKRLRGTVIA